MEIALIFRNGDKTEYWSVPNKYDMLLNVSQALFIKQEKSAPS